MKRFLRYTIRIIFSVLFLLILLPSLLYIPGIQSFVKNKASSILSEKTGWNISIDRFRLHFPLEVHLSGVDALTEQGDTLFHLSSFRTGVAFMPLLKGKVVVAKLSLEDIYSNMDELIQGLDIKGHIGNLTIEDVDVSLSRQSGDIKNILLENADVGMRIGVLKSDTVKEESAPVNWQFRIGQLAIRKTGYSLSMLESGLDLACRIEKGTIRQGKILLDENVYSASSLQIQNSSYRMDLDTVPVKPGFDPAHLAMTAINIKADSIYNCGTTVRARISDASFHEKCGFELTSLKGSYRMDSLMMQIRDLDLKTPFSHLALNAQIDQSIFKTPRQGSVNTHLNASLAKEDVLYFITAYAPEAAHVYPDQKLSLSADISGDMKQLNVQGVDFSLPGAFVVNGKGALNELRNTKKTNGDIQLNGEFIDISFVPLLLPDTALRHQIKIPQDIALNGHLFAETGQFSGGIKLSFDHSSMDLNGSYYPAQERYMVRLQTDNLDLARFLPTSSLGILDMHIDAHGAGFDPMLPAAQAQVNAAITRLDVNKYKIRSLTLDAGLEKSHYSVTLVGADTILKMDLSLDGLLSRKEITADLNADLKRIDLYNLQILQTETVISAFIEATAKTDLHNLYQLSMKVKDMQLRDQGVLNKLGTLMVNADINADSTRVSAKNGDLELKFEAVGGLDSLIYRLDRSVALAEKQIMDKTFDIQRIQGFLPEMVLQFAAGTQNALYGYVKSTGIQYKKADLLVSNEKGDGIRISGVVDGLRKDTFLLNSVNLDIHQQANHFEYQVTGVKKDKNPRRAFQAVASGLIENNGLSLDMLYKNGLDKIGLDLGLRLSVSPQEMRVRMEPVNPIILYRNWSLNPDNFIALNSDKHLLANFSLTGEKGMQLTLISRDTLLAEGKSDLDVALKRFDLSQISEVLPDMPPFSGMFNAGMNVAFDKDQIDAYGLITLDTLTYNKRRMGDLALNVNYESAKVSGQWAYASIQLEKEKIMEADLRMVPKDSVEMAAHLFLYQLPLKLADPFIPDATASLVGTATGELTMEKIKNEPHISGKIDLDTAAVTVSYANATYHLDDKPLIIEDNILRFSNYQIRAYNSNPLLLNGVFNFMDFNRMIADLRITGNNVELLNVPKQKNQMIYGRLMMNVNTTVTGPLNLLRIRGGINLLTGTNVNYVMLDSPVSAQNRVANLVTFTNFNDTIDSNYKLPITQPAISGIDMLVTVNIAPTVQVGIDLSTNGDDRVELQGGGDLAYKMTPMGETDLSGRYSLSGGFVRYNLPILPIAKTFNIQNGSYVEWSGKLMDPYINITASETIRSTVTEDGKGSRVVTFEPMIEIKNRLDNLSVVFTVQAPEDLTIQNQLAQMTPEERSRQAMNLIITQTYSGPGTTSKANANNALNAFIQKEINSFAGSALKGVDLSFGIDTYDQYGSEGQSGGKRTDYSFRFSKRLFNDRFRIIVGGTVSSGQDVSADQQQNFIDDVTLEYMLDKSGTRYLKLFHHTGFESVFEGEVIETGIGAVLKRRVRKVRQLFIFNDQKRERAINAEPKEDTLPVPVKSDAIKPKEEEKEENEPASGSKNVTK